MNDWRWSSSLTLWEAGGSNNKLLEIMFESFRSWPELPLDSMERISETLFALMMVPYIHVLIQHCRRWTVRELLRGALGCNVAWGIIDAAFYLMGSFSLRGQGILKLKALPLASTFGACQCTSNWRAQYGPARH